MKPLKVHVLYEYGKNHRPYPPSFIRLLRPLSHPTISNKILLTAGCTLDDSFHPDVVIVDRLWNTFETGFLQATALVDKIRVCGAKFIYSFDDNFVLIPFGKEGYSQSHFDSFKLFLQESDGAIVSSDILKETFLPYQPNILTVPNMLDEKLIDPRCHLFNSQKDKLVIGFMGTNSHQEDLISILPAWQTIYERYPQKVSFEIIGIEFDNNGFWKQWNIPLKVINPQQSGKEYPLFMRWFTHSLNWDIALAPLLDSPFNRSKSDIKFLDYAAAEICGIFSRNSIYSKTVTDLEDGLIVDNNQAAWVTAMETLINDFPLRRKIAMNASRHLFSRRILAKQSYLWVQAIEDLL